MKTFTLIFLLTAYGSPSNAHAEQWTFTWPGGMKPVEASRCNPWDWEFRKEYDQARGTAANMAIQQDYDMNNCQELNPTYYYRDKAKECVVIAQLFCKK